MASSRPLDGLYVRPYHTSSTLIVYVDMYFEDVRFVQIFYNEMPILALNSNFLFVWERMYCAYYMYICGPG